MEHFDFYLQKLINWGIAFIPNLIKAVVILFIGMLLIKFFRRFMNRLMLKNEHDPTVLKFLMDLFTWIFRVALIISVITTLGVPNTSFVAILGAAGLAIGLSLQGSLSNFAGGLLIILFKPFRVGDYIEAQGQAGTVNSIQIFSTRIITPNNQVIYMPNGALSNGTIKNFSQEELRRAEIVLSVAYNSDLKMVKEIIYSVAGADDKILETPAPNVEIRALAENSIDIVVFIWTERKKYGAMVSEFYENIKTAFEKQGIEIPYPQRDINIIQKQL